MRTRETAGERSRKAAERLLAELWACSKDQREALLQEERFQSPALLELLLEECHAALPFDLARGAEILAMATPLRGLTDDPLTMVPGFDRRSRFYCLGGTVCRLLGDHPRAESFFEKVAVLNVSRTSQGFFCRSLGLLRWDQGRLAEAAALLHHAVDLFQGEDCAREASACLALTGLLAIERIDFVQAEGVLTTALRDLDSQGWPWLTCGAALALSLLLSPGDADESRANRERARRLYGEIPHEPAQIGLHWLEGRAALGLREHEHAVRLLDSVRRKFLAARWLPEATLATFDLAQALAESGRGEEMEPLADDLSQVFEGRPKVDMAVLPLQCFAAQAQALGPDRYYWLCSVSALRQLFRADRVFLQPVPFA